ncbi:hypothetical protein CR513_31683, partial [Mucuna pruriens]
MPFSLHQQVKFINDHQIISIMGEKELVITTLTPEEYIEGDEEALEASFYNRTLKYEEPDQPSKPSEGISTEAEALADIERWIDREKSKFEAPREDLESINLGEGIEGREVRIGKQVPPNLRVKLVELLREYANVFAWSYQDMPGLDCQIVEHQLPLLPGVTPIRQQLRRMRPEVALKIKDEVEKQWNVGFLAVANYPQWVANIVHRMCVDYKDLNNQPQRQLPVTAHRCAH